MSTFDPHWDSPEQIKQEGEEVELSFDRLTSTTGRVSWHIPPPSHGCNAENQAYCGMLVVLNTVVNRPANKPEDGIRYVGDPTADVDLHAGDDLNGALVIGAFYDDRTTVTFDVTGLVDGAAYFVTGHAVDCQNRYHQDGISAYSLPLELNPKGEDTCAFHEVTLNDDAGGVLPGDVTGLDIGRIYDFALTIDEDPQIQVEIDGAFGQTYQELTDEINKQLQLLLGPFQGPVPPNTGAYFYNLTTGELFQWDGNQHILIPVINHPSEPNVVAAGDYWLDTDSELDELFRRDVTNSVWDLQTPQLETGFDVINPPCDTFWYNDGPCIFYAWNGTTWCIKAPVFVQTTDPSDPESLECGSYWLDDNGVLFCWTEISDGCFDWVQVEAISWDLPPNQIVNGTYWFNDTTNELNLRVGGAWELRPDAFIQEDQPGTTFVGAEWFIPSTEQLFVLDQTGTFVEVDVLVFGSDPTDIFSCDFWFNTATNLLFTWDEVNQEWDQVAQFFDQTEDPSSPKVLPDDSIWVDNTDTVNFVFNRWDGAQFVLISREDVVIWASDPNLIPAGTIWLMTGTSIYMEWDGSMWITLDPIESPTDPTVVAVGTFWFNTSNDMLNQWNGTAWIVIAYSTVPLNPSVGDFWFDTSNDLLFTWDSIAWVPGTAKVEAVLNQAEPEINLCSPEGNITFNRTECGSFFMVQIGAESISSTQIAFPSVQFNFDGTLFPALNASAILKEFVGGGDGLEKRPMYEQEGVGTDGSPDERRELIESIKKQMGHPTVTVELDKKQMDEAVQSALEELRLRSASAYRRVYFFMDLRPTIQRYKLTNKAVGFNTIVNVMGMWRVTSAFQSTAYAAGVYGQTVLQHLYHMGTFDLVSYHIVSDYIEQLEMLFATRITYAWNESTRDLDVYQTITRPERVLLDCVIERTEQELLTNRWTKNWLERWALAQAQMTLSEIRGKFATLPGAGGGVALNAADLEEKARFNMEQCHADIDNFVVNDIEDLGIGSELIIG